MLCNILHHPPPKSDTLSLLPNFNTFHESFLNLEDELFDHCNEYWEEVDDSDHDWRKGEKEMMRGKESINDDDNDDNDNDNNIDDGDD